MFPFPPFTGADKMPIAPRMAPAPAPPVARAVPMGLPGGQVAPGAMTALHNRPPPSGHRPSFPRHRGFGWPWWGVNYAPYWGYTVDACANARSAYLSWQQAEGTALATTLKATFEGVLFGGQCWAARSSYLAWQQTGSPALKAAFEATLYLAAPAAPYYPWGGYGYRAPFGYPWGGLPLGSLQIIGGRP